MLARLSIIEAGIAIGDEVLDEIEGEALMILERAGHHAPLLVAAARHAIDTVGHLRTRSHARQRTLLQSA